MPSRLLRQSKGGIGGRKTFAKASDRKNRRFKSGESAKPEAAGFARMGLDYPNKTLYNKNRLCGKGMENDGAPHKEETKQAGNSAVAKPSWELQN